jgi:hypothetical protein
MIIDRGMYFHANTRSLLENAEHISKNSKKFSRERNVNHIFVRILYEVFILSGTTNAGHIKVSVMRRGD